MFKVLITGNGFDLYHALPTTYGYLMSILKKIETIDFNQKGSTISYKDIFGRGWIEIEANYKVEKVNFNTQKLNELQSFLKDNIWYHYFKNILELNSWIEFEQEIKKALEVIQDFFIIVENRFSENSISTKFVDNTFETAYIFRKLRNLNILLEDSEAKSAHQSTVGYVKKSYILNNDYFTLQQSDTFLNEHKILEDLVHALEELKIIFNSYFTYIISPFYKEVKEDSTIKTLMNEDLLMNIKHFFTFSYLPTIENLYKKDNVDYIHGRINEDNSLQNIVLGIDELPEELMKYRIFDFTKYFQKINQNTNFQVLNLFKNNKDTEEVVFYIWGLSLDESDRVYVEALFNQLESLPNCKLVIFYHTNQSIGGKVKTSLLNNLLYIMKESEVTKMIIQEKLVFLELTKENLEAELLD